MYHIMRVMAVISYVCLFQVYVLDPVDIFQLVKFN